MNKRLILKLSVILSIFFGLFSSCTFDSGEPQLQYWTSYGTYQLNNSDYDFTILFDNGQVFLPQNDAEFAIELDTNTRVLITYSITSSTVDKIKGEISEMKSVRTADIIQLTEALEDSVGNDGIYLNEEGIWLSKYHLNVAFSAYGGGEVHYIHLVKPIGEQTDTLGNQILELRHNANEDRYTQLIDGLIAFRMDSLYEEGLDSLPFVLRSYDYDSVLTEIKMTHYFDGSNALKTTTMDKPIELSALVD